MRFIRIAAVLTLLTILAGCVSASQRRQRYLEANPGLKPEVAAAIREGKIVEGMTTKDVQAAWGTPDRETLAVIEGGDQETWSYSTPIGQFTDGKVILIFSHRKLIKLIN